MPLTDKQKEYQRKYRLNHKEQRREYGKKYLDTHKEYLKELWRQYHITHREQRNEQTKQWQLTHKEQRHQYNLAYREKKNELQQQRRIARKEKGLCIVCGQPRSENNSQYCLLHLAQAIQRHKKTNNNPEYRERQKVYSKTKYCQRKSENKCVHCGMPLNEESRMGFECLNCYNSRNRPGY